MDKTERCILYVMLTQMKGLGPVRQNELLAKSGGIEKLFEMPEDEEPETAAERAFLRMRGSISLRERAVEIFDAAQLLGVQIINREDPAYPKRFKGLSDSPAVLYALGDLRINAFDRSVGIVGARRCTKEGRQQAIDAAASAVNAGKAVVSGMAKGVDSYAHTAAVRSGGYTIAVLGNSPEICYPKEHQTLYEKIIETGCILSEYPPGTGPRNYTFPRRNRIIAGLSDELFVIDAGRNSGTHTTVEAWKKIYH